MSDFTTAGGLSKARLARMHDIMAGHVEAGDMPGLVTLVSRRVDPIGKMALGGAPMQRDSIFRVASMTKPHRSRRALSSISGPPSIRRPTTKTASRESRPGL